MSGEGEDPFSYEYDSNKDGENNNNKEENKENLNEFFEEENKEKNKETEPIQEKKKGKDGMEETAKTIRTFLNTLFKQGKIDFCGLFQLDLRDFPLPLLSPNFFTSLKSARNSWTILLIWLDILGASFLSVVNLFAFFYSLVIYIVDVIPVDVTLVILGCVFSLCLCCCVIPVGLVTKYLPLWKSQTDDGIVSRILFVVFLVFLCTSVLFYGFLLIGVLNVGIAQFFVTILHIGEIGVLIFDGIVAVLLLGWLTLLICNVIVLVFYGVQLLKKIKKSDNTSSSINESEQI